MCKEVEEHVNKWHSTLMCTHEHGHRDAQTCMTRLEVLEGPRAAHFWFTDAFAMSVQD